MASGVRGPCRKAGMAELDDNAPIAKRRARSIDGRTLFEWLQDRDNWLAVLQLAFRPDWCFAAHLRSLWEGSTCRWLTHSIRSAPMGPQHPNYPPVPYACTDGTSTGCVVFVLRRARIEDSRKCANCESVAMRALSVVPELAPKACGRAVVTRCTLCLLHTLWEELHGVLLRCWAQAPSLLLLWQVHMRRVRPHIAAQSGARSD